MLNITEKSKNSQKEVERNNEQNQEKQNVRKLPEKIRARGSDHSEKKHEIACIKPKEVKC